MTDLLGPIYSDLTSGSLSLHYSPFFFFFLFNSLVTIQEACSVSPQACILSGAFHHRHNKTSLSLAHPLWSGSLVTTGGSYLTLQPCVGVHLCLRSASICTSCFSCCCFFSLDFPWNHSNESACMTYSTGIQHISDFFPETVSLTIGIS